MYGPPGNGKTISIKAIMKGAIDKGYSPLYVKSFKSNRYAPRRFRPFLLLISTVNRLGRRGGRHLPGLRKGQDRGALRRDP